MTKIKRIKTSIIAFLLIQSTISAQEEIAVTQPVLQETPTPALVVEGTNNTQAKEVSQEKKVAPKRKKNDKKSLLTHSSEEMRNYVKVTLIDVVLEAVSNNFNVKASREKVRQAQINLDDAYSGYKPTVGVEYKVGTTTVTPSDEGVDSGENKYHDETVTVQLTQNIYAGGATANKIKALEKSLEVAKNRYELAISQEIQNAIKAYLGVVFSYQSLYATRINMEMLEKILEIVTVKYDLGAASLGDISSIKASVSNAESKLSKTNSKFVEALKYYEYIVGDAFQYTLPYEYEFEIEIAPLDELLELGNTQNLNIVSYLTTVESEQYKLKGSKAAFLPKIDFELSHTRTYDKDIAPEDFYRQNTNEAYVTFSYNLYNGNKDSNKILSGYSTIRETKYKIEEERRKLKWIVSNLHQSLNALDDSISSTKQEVDSSQLTVESYWEAFKNGEQDLQTLLTAQRQLNTAQVSLIESYQNRLNDYYKLIFEIGELVEHFNLDPTKDNFIDFTASTYNRNKVHAKNDADLVAFASIFEKKDKEKKEAEKNIEVVDTLEDILVFKDKFLDANDDDLTLYIGKFDTIYDTFGYMKNKQLSSQAFMVDILEDYKLKNIMAYGIYETQEEAQKVLDEVEKEENLEYKILSIRTIKDWYKRFIDGFDELRPKELVETKTIKMALKQPEPYFTNAEFKEKFMASQADKYTINLVTFTQLDDAIKLVNKEEIAENSLIFRYGTQAEWIKVVYGVFDTYEEANTALSRLSAETIEKYFPVIEFIKDKQDLYYKYQDLELGKPSFRLGKPEYETVFEELKVELRKSKERLVLPSSSAQEEPNEKEKETKEKETNNDEINKEETTFPNNETAPIIVEENENSTVQEEIQTEETPVQESVQDKPISQLDNTFEEKFLSASTNSYSVNLATLNSQDEVNRFVALHRLENQVFTFSFGSEKTYFKVMYNIFSNYDEAKLALQEMPTSLQRNKPYMEPIHLKQALYKKYHLQADTTKSEIQS